MRAKMEESMAIIFGTSGSDVSPVLDGSGLADIIFAELGNDEADGGGGDDFIFGKDGDDILDGGNGNDALFGETGDDTLNGEGGNDALDGETGNDTLNGGNGNDALSGGAGTDTLNGNNGDDALNGGAGTDTLNGNNGDDALNGGADNDTLNGNNGNDVLAGQAGADDLNGGNGNDRFVYISTDDSTVALSGRDEIQDFDSAENDVIDLSLIDANTAVLDDQAFLLGRYTEANGLGPVGPAGGIWLPQSLHVDVQDDVVYGNVDADETAEFAIDISGLTLANIAFTDFIA
jgi:Ca2+-binding RTX toxin-like protein